MNRFCTGLALFGISAGLLVAQSFQSTGSMNEPRQNHAATLLNNGRILVTGGYPSNGTAELYDPVTGTWRYTAHPMIAAREYHSATLLLDGRVLIVGGSPPGSGTWLQSAEVFDPVSEGFTAVHPSNFAHSSYEPAILLNDGRVLVVGGDVGSEIYDPKADSWTIIPSIPIGDRWSSAVKLSDGTVVAMGGDVANPGCCTSAGVYRYDPVSNTVTQLAPMLVARVLQTATLLPSGQVLIAAGSNEFSSFNSTELYDPSVPGGHSQFGSTLNQPRQQHRTTLLPNGDVLVTGGVLGATSPPLFYNTAELRDHTTGLWTFTQPMSAPRYLHTATLLPSGAVLIAGGGPGSPTNSAEIWNGTSATSGFAPTGSMNEARQSHTATLLGSGKVLVTGGNSSGTAEIYDPVMRTWRYTAHPMQQPRESHSATLLIDGRVLIVGPNVSAEVFDPAIEQFTLVHPPNYAHGLQPSVMLNDGRVLVIGGDLGSEIYNPANDTWTPISAVPVGDREFPAVRTADGTVLTMGGDITNPGCCISSSVYRYDPTSNIVSQMASMLVGRVDHTASILPSGQVVIVGGTDGGLSISSTEVYDPAIQPSGQSELGSSLHDARRHHVATLFSNGDVFVTGGYQALAGNAVTAYLDSTELRDHTTGIWTSAGIMSTPRNGHTATLLNSGSVLVAGGGPGSPTNTAEIWTAPLAAEGTIQVATNLPGASFTITGPTTYQGGGASFTQANAPVGSYTITYAAAPGYVTPASQTLMLTAGGTITFTGTYQQPTGTIVVTTNLASATFTIMGPANYNASGTSFTINNAPLGIYQVHYNDVAKNITPPDQTGTLGAGQPLIFPTATYTPIMLTACVVGYAGCVQSLSFPDQKGIAGPISPQHLSITSNASSLAFTASSISTPSGWLSLSSTTGNTPTMLDIVVGGVSTFAPGTYIGKVVISAINANNSPQILAVSLNVLAGPVLPAQGVLTISTNIDSAQYIIQRANGAPSAPLVETGRFSIIDNLSVGKYLISFNSISGYYTPSPQQITVLPGSSTELTAIYTRAITILFTGYLDHPTTTQSSFPGIQYQSTEPCGQNCPGLLTLASEAKNDNTLGPGLLAGTFTFYTGSNVNPSVPIVGTMPWVFGPPDESPHVEAMTWLQTTARPTINDKIFVIGHSYGGNRARLFEQQLATRSLTTSGLVTLDPIDWSTCSIQTTIGFTFDSRCNQSGVALVPGAGVEHVLSFTQTHSIALKGYHFFDSAISAAYPYTIFNDPSCPSNLDPLNQDLACSHEKIAINPTIHDAIIAFVKSNITNPQLAIYNLDAIEITANTATISWLTEETTQAGTVTISQDLSFSSSVSIQEQGIASKTHSVPITELQPNTLYYAKVAVESSAGKQMSEPIAFKTTR
jgi:hypothetical protein